ncbi:hypothetical protein FLW53_17280 [Microbispora sp. SCL1-1]|uniref:hypothetical protein n=1 Tax=unclassified Microbispora TaxID=2614687 RepID=UPI00115C3EC1|nr:MULTISPECIES: hypothetical protein [unclassified Microbispora]NJP25921.1 hypothetical protein [Microbispora sp. CL1-1]TQS13038.1 hypothetical protein FLW53_17280 [Microbispora sp. SCL1-1]
MPTRVSTGPTCVPWPARVSWSARARLPGTRAGVTTGRPGVCARLARVATVLTGVPTRLADICAERTGVPTGWACMAAGLAGLPVRAWVLAGRTCVPAVLAGARARLAGVPTTGLTWVSAVLTWPLTFPGPSGLVSGTPASHGSPLSLPKLWLGILTPISGQGRRKLWR